MLIACLGPPPTFSDGAARAFDPKAGRLHVARIPALFSALLSGEAERAVLPMESSVAGPVRQTLLEIRNAREPLVQLAERWMPVRFSLYRRPGDDAPLRLVLSHDMSLRQCAAWLDWSGASGRPAENNGAAMAEAAASREPGVAAIGPEGERFPGLAEIEIDLQGPQTNATRFVLAALAGHAPDAPDAPALIAR